MSKISQLHAELSSQAYDLGFNSLEDALAMGYEVDYENSKLVDGREQAHKAWLKEKEEVLDGLDIVAHSDYVPFEHKEIVKQAIEFIKKGEM